MPKIRRMGYLLVLLFGGALTTMMVWHPVPPPRFAGVAGGQVPRAVDGYTGRDYMMPPEVRTTLASADIISRTYTDAGGDPIDFVLIGGTNRNALHDPRSCLVGGGWKLEDDRTETLPGTQVAARACHAVGLPGVPGCDIVYLYVVDGHIVNEVTQIRAAMLWSALLGRKNTPVYFLRFLRPLKTDTDAAASGADHARLQAFAARMWGALSPRLLKG